MNHEIGEFINRISEYCPPKQLFRLVRLINTIDRPDCTTTWRETLWKIERYVHKYGVAFIWVISDWYDNPHSCWLMEPYKVYLHPISEQNPDGYYSIVSSSGIAGIILPKDMICISKGVNP